MHYVYGIMCSTYILCVGRVFQCVDVFKPGGTSRWVSQWRRVSPSGRGESKDLFISHRIHSNKFIYSNSIKSKKEGAHTDPPDFGNIPPNSVQKDSCS